MADERDQRYSPRPQGTATLINRSGWDRDSQMFIDLQAIARFARRWWVIYLLSLTYLVVVFPAVFRIGREASDYRWVYVALLLSVGLFSYGFASLGKLGASEVDRERSVAVAQQLREGLYDVTQWTCVGVRTGGKYTVDHRGTGRLYTTAQDIERVDGQIVAGPQARMNLDIPPASTRTILSRRRVEGPPLGLQVASSAFGELGLSSLSVQVGPQFPDDPMVVLVAQGRQVYQLRLVGDLLTLVPSSRRPLESFLTEHLQVAPIGPGTGLTKRQSHEDPHSALAVYENAMRTLIGNSFGLRERLDRTRLELPADLLRVFVYAPQPPELQMIGESFPDRQGYVMYCVDLPLRGSRLPSHPQTGAGEQGP